MNRSNRGAIAGLFLLGVSGVSNAADPYAAPAYPQQYPPQYPQQYPQPQYAQSLDSQPGSMRRMFASTVATVAQSTGSAAIVAVADGLTGALKSWFDNRRQRKGNNGAIGASYAPAQPSAYPQPSSNPQSSAYPQPSTYPQPGDPNAYPPSNDAPWNTSAPADAGTPSTNYQPQATPAPVTAPGALYAGIAYEVHLLQPDGSTAPVDVAGYAFHTGDQFRVYYRPSLPGRVEVFNINPAGQQAQIDSSNVAAGELASLGPYQFTDLQGDETLILKLTPCMTPTLTATTRDIVKVQGATPDYSSAVPVSNPLGIDSCSSTATRGLRSKTRDIRKVTVEGGTSFALDPIAPTELGGGDLSPRQVTITLHHR